MQFVLSTCIICWWCKSMEGASGAAAREWISLFSFPILCQNKCTLVYNCTRIKYLMTQLMYSSHRKELRPVQKTFNYSKASYLDCSISECCQCGHKQSVYVHWCPKNGWFKVHWVLHCLQYCTLMYCIVYIITYYIISIIYYNIIVIGVPFYQILH